MIADLDKTIENILVEEMPINNGEIDVKFDQPTREWSARLSRPTINLFLYDVRENNVLRQHQWERLAQQNGRNHHDVSQKRTPYRIDCAYMMTTWAAEPQDEHRLLSRAMMALFRYPVLPASRLVGDLQDQPFKLQSRLASHDRLTNPAELWGSMDNEIRPSVSFLVTLAMDPWTAVTGPAVRTFSFQYGQANDLPDQKAVEEGTSESKTYIGGFVRKAGEPQPGLQVALKGTGLFAVTDKEGLFRLDVPEGSHTLVTWLEDGKPQERPITVPGEDYDIEI